MTYDIFINQGSSFSGSFVATDSFGNLINLSGYSTRGKIKMKFGCTGYLVDMTPQIASGFTSGIINVLIPPEITSGMPVTKGVYDIEAFNSGDYCFQVANGYVNIFPEVSFY